MSTRREQAIAAVQEVFGLARENIILKSRERKRGTQQYEAQDQSKSFFAVNEGPARLWINLKDYLDTGLFLDHRPIRKFIRENAKGKRFLNLFCYTASASVQAALGGATSTLSIDLSNTYLDWARQNFLLNKISGKNHRLKKADCVDYLSSKYEKFDLIFLDPPTFSNSKSSSNVLDIQKDHGTIIHNAMNKLERDGLLIFSTNKLNFKLASESLKMFGIRDYTKSSLGKDFQRQKKIHQTWLISHKWSPPDLLVINLHRDSLRLNIYIMKTATNCMRLLFFPLICLLLSLNSAAALAADASNPPLIGSWGGPLVIGEDDLGLIFNFSMTGGEYSASIISDGLGVYGMPADRVRLNGRSLTVVIGRLNVEFTGTLRFDEAGENLLRIDANWFQGSEMVPVVLRPVE